MNESGADLLARFRNGSTIIDRWTAARELMAARQLSSVLESDDFKIGFNEVAKEAEVEDGIARLIAIDLIVRLSRFAKKLKPQASRARTEASRIRSAPSTLSRRTDSVSLLAGTPPSRTRHGTIIPYD